MEIHSAYMKKVVLGEEDRIRKEIALSVYRSFKDAGYRVSVSHDSQNESEKTALAGKQFLDLVFNSDWDSDRCWVFAAKNGMKSPLWVLLVLDNVEDLISDYHMGAEAILAKANETAEKYQ
jgi:aminopeptidase C